MGRRKRIGLLGLICVPILSLGKLNKISKKLTRFYVRPKRSGVMSSGPRRKRR